MYSAILIPIDLGQDSSWQKALPTAVELARLYSAELHVITVFPEFGLSMVAVNFPADYEQTGLAELRRALDAFVAEQVPEGIRARTHVAHGSIYSEIIEAADKLKCDLIVLSAHRPEMRDYLIGPNAGRVVRHANQSVFVVRD